jgi:hypothetical protein
LEDISLKQIGQKWATDNGATLENTDAKFVTPLAGTLFKPQTGHGTMTVGHSSIDNNEMLQ